MSQDALSVSYQHRWWSGATAEKSVFSEKHRVNLPIGKAVCVGRNYAEHAKELGNPVPEKPLLFMKPKTCFRDVSPRVVLPSVSSVGEHCHVETELVLLIGQDLVARSGVFQGDAKALYAARQHQLSAIAGVGLAFDLTLRERQNTLKKNGHPWEIAKAFDGACPLSAFIPFTAVSDPAVWSGLQFSLDRNGHRQQTGAVANMLTPIDQLLWAITEYFTLEAGDVVLTGTPAGVGPLSSGDVLQLRLFDQNNLYLTVDTRVF